jgi:hypothetical protein
VFGTSGFILIFPLFFICLFLPFLFKPTIFCH